MALRRGWLAIMKSARGLKQRGLACPIRWMTRRPEHACFQRCQAQPGFPVAIQTCEPFPPSPRHREWASIDPTTCPRSSRTSMQPWSGRTATCSARSTWRPCSITQLKCTTNTATRQKGSGNGALLVRCRYLGGVTGDLVAQHGDPSGVRCRYLGEIERGGIARHRDSFRMRCRSCDATADTPLTRQQGPFGVHCRLTLRLKGASQWAHILVWTSVEPA